MAQVRVPGGVSRLTPGRAVVLRIEPALRLSRPFGLPSLTPPRRHRRLCALRLPTQPGAPAARSTRSPLLPFAVVDSTRRHCVAFLALSGDSAPASSGDRLRLQGGIHKGCAFTDPPPCSPAAPCAAVHRAMNAKQRRPASHQVQLHGGVPSHTGATNNRRTFERQST